MLLSILFLVKVKTYIVNGESMQPTFQNKDRLFIKKTATLTRYSLITFQPQVNADDSYIKRVIGLPGDRIWLDQNMVYLNAQMASNNSTPSNNSNLSGIELPDGTLKVRVTWEVAAQLAGLSVIPKDKFFVLGDNRRHSTDSRELGLIDKQAVKGKVIFRYYPFTRFGVVN
ncbi:signal peptidase I [Enterococcus caccae]|nr:signal peptidase I [Enterococcus caccae]